MGRLRTAASRRIGLRQIADELGVSICLVSRVLNGRLAKGEARESTIRAVQEKARELGYRKNAQAVALQAGRQNVIAVYLHGHGVRGSGIMEQMTDGIADEARGHHQRLILHRYLSAEEFRDLAGGAHPNAVDGVIVGGFAHEELLADLLALRKLGLPVVTIHNGPLHASLPNVGMDQREVGHMATRHLIAQGCRRIAHFRVRLPDRPLPHDRYEGYRLALREAGQRFTSALVVEVDGFDYESGAAAIHALLERGVAFDGLVAQSDYHAAAALNALVSAGRRVPQDIKIIGVDNSPICTPAMVPLSSISQEFLVRGRQAVRLLMRQVSGRTIRSVEVKPVVCVRASTASRRVTG